MHLRTTEQFLRKYDVTSHRNNNKQRIHRVCRYTGCSTHSWHLTSIVRQAICRIQVKCRIATCRQPTEDRKTCCRSLINSRESLNVMHVLQKSNLNSNRFLNIQYTRICIFKENHEIQLFQKLKIIRFYSNFLTTLPGFRS